jgi:hypothetical protein
LIIKRFGLNHDFIRSQGLSTIPNLITGSGKDLADPNHRDRRRKLPYIETYLEQFGAWKCEANALVTRTEAGRELFRQALMPYVDRDGVRRYNEAVAAARAELRQAMPAFLREKLLA